MKCPIIDFETHRKKTVWPLIYAICETMNCTPEEIRIVSIKPYAFDDLSAEVWLELNGINKALSFKCNKNFLNEEEASGDVN